MGDDFARLERRIKALEANRGAILRWCEVVAADETAGSARVRIDDAEGIVSMPLRVLQRRTLKDQHQELPDLGEHVACLFAGQGFEQGVVLGAIYSDKDPCPGKEPQALYRKFEDGTELEYDRKSHRLTGTVKGWVDLTVEKDVDVKVLQKVTIDAKDDILIRSGKTITLQGATSIVLRTPSLIIQGITGVCNAVMTAAFNLIGGLTHQGDYGQEGSHTLSGDVKAGGSVTDSAGNTNHHSHP
jgi:phage baseplate assembly protein V